MTQLLRRFRGLAIALAILAISAGAVFAAAPRIVPNGAPVAFDEPVDPPAVDEDGDGSEDGDAGTDEDGDTDGDADEDTDGDESAEAGDAEGTHGGFVSQVAQSDTPEGFENHGAYVSCAARLPDDLVAAAATGVTLEICLEAADRRATEKVEKHAAQLALKAQRAADREARKADRDLLDDVPNELPDEDGSKGGGQANTAEKAAERAERAAARDAAKAERGKGKH